MRLDQIACKHNAVQLFDIVEQRADGVELFSRHNKTIRNQELFFECMSVSPKIGRPRYDDGNPARCVCVQALRV